MKHQVQARAVALIALAAASGACKQPKEKTHEGTLSLLRDSLVTGRPPIERVADTRIVQEAAFLHGVTRLSASAGVTLSVTGVEHERQEITRRAEPQAFFAGVRGLLRDGHCERIGNSTVPPGLARIPESVPSWPQNARELQVSVARRLAETAAGDFRCDGGPSFRAVFVRPERNDGTWRVAQIGPGGRP